jgi:hypothetical protein
MFEGTAVVVGGEIAAPSLARENPETGAPTIVRMTTDETNDDTSEARSRDNPPKRYSCYLR